MMWRFKKIQLILPKFFWFALCFTMINTPGYGDIITLKDGGTLRCEVLEETISPDTGARYLQIRVDQSMIWLNRDTIERIDYLSVSESGNKDIQTLLDRLIEQGKIVPEIREQLDFVTPPSQPSPDIPLRAKNIRGWAYLYENDNAVFQKKRSPLKEGEAIPKGTILILSPNTRVTLEMPGIGKIGLEGGTRVRFADFMMDRPRNSYKITIYLTHGHIWLQMGTGERSWKRVNLTLNSVKSVIQDALLYASAEGKAGEVDVLLLQGSKSLQFWRSHKSEAPYLLKERQHLQVLPGSNRLSTEDSPKATRLLRQWEKWDSWKPEPLAVALEMVIPPLKVRPPFRAQPVLHPYKITIDRSLFMPPETRSLGEILAIYKKGLNRYKRDLGKYPSFDQGLNSLSGKNSNPRWKGPYISLDLPRKDSWGNDFIYDIYKDKGRQYVDVRSPGPNGIDDKGLDDDIR